MHWMIEYKDFFLNILKNNMVTVASVDCSLEADLCKQLGQTSGVAFYPVHQVTQEQATVCTVFWLTFATKFHIFSSLRILTNSSIP